MLVGVLFHAEDFVLIKMTKYKMGALCPQITKWEQNRKNCTRQNIPQQLHLSLFLYHTLSYLWPVLTQEWYTSVAQPQ